MHAQNHVYLSYALQRGEKKELTDHAPVMPSRNGSGRSQQNLLHRHIHLIINKLIKTTSTHAYHCSYFFLDGLIQKTK